MIIRFVGAGRVGKTLGALCVQRELATVGGVCNRTLQSAHDAIAFMGQGVAYNDLEALPWANITWITTPDIKIAPTALALSRLETVSPIVVHCSGTLSSDALAVLRQRGCHLASVHPMRSFADPGLSVAHYAGTYCALEGDDAALRVLRPLLEAMGSVTFSVAKEHKARYHAAGVFASNYVITLAEQALSCLTGAGLEHELAMKIIVNVMQSAVTQLGAASVPAQALTGPIARADEDTLHCHQEALSTKEQQTLYRILGQATLALTTHDHATLRRLHDLLSEREDVTM